MKGVETLQTAAKQNEGVRIMDMIVGKVLGLY
jgi:hypothetical protein